MIADAIHSGVAFFAPILILAALAGWMLRERDARKSYQRRMQNRMRDERDRGTDPRAR